MATNSMRGVAAYLVSLVLVVAGCAPEASEEPAPSPPAGWPAELADFTIVWTAEPGIDLTADGAAIATRAFTESYYLVSITGDEKYLYPGFAEAVDKNQSEIGSADGNELWPHSYSADVWIGTARQHVLRITRSDGDAIVTACSFLYGSAIERPNGKYNANVGKAFVPAPGVYPMQIGLRAPEDMQSELPPQQGASRAPSDNVFAGWKITSHQSGYMTTSRWAEYDRDMATCIDKADGDPGIERVNPTVLYPRSDFPTLPATPGWPDKPAS